MTLDRIDAQGYRANVGIVICDERCRLLLGGRIGHPGWQFPQGGIRFSESVEQAMYRELHEEVGLQPHDVEILGCTRRWVRYRLPERFIRRDSQPLCIGQKQRWYLLRLQAPKSCLRADTTSTPEFDRWRWVQYWDPVEAVIYFKRRVYRRVLEEFVPLLPPDRVPEKPAWPVVRQPGASCGP